MALFAAGFGLFHLLFTLGSFLGLVKRHLFKGRSINLKKYGEKDSWAVVTGGSDGIGFAIAQQLAREGFNICIIARNQEKMQAKLSEIEKNAPVKTKCVVCDFGQVSTLTAYD